MGYACVFTKNGHLPELIDQGSQPLRIRADGILR